MQLRLFERNSCVHPHSEISVGISANSKVDTALLYWFALPFIRKYVCITQKYKISPTEDATKCDLFTCPYHLVV